MEKVNNSWEWYSQYDSYECPYCLVLVSPSKTMITKNSIRNIYNGLDYVYSYLYFCNNCGRPTFQDGFKSNELFPKKIFGREIEISEEYKKIQKAFNELRKCISVNAFTAAVMIGRKLLAIITFNYPETSDEIKTKIEKGLIKFSECVDELKKIRALPIINHHLLDKIRKMGNDANHELNEKTEEDAKEIYNAIELIMKTFENAEIKTENLSEIENKEK